MHRNKRNSYREVPSFGRDTIRRFSSNCSEMKKMAAHDFENLLQVCFVYDVVFDMAQYPFSVQFPSLMDFFLNPITELS